MADELGWESQTNVILPSSSSVVRRRIGGIKGRSGFAFFAPFVPNDWDTHPFQPPHPPRERRYAAMVQKDDGTQFPLIRFLPFGWFTPPIQPPPPQNRITNAGAIMVGDQGTQARFIRFFPNDWDTHPPQPPHPPQPDGRFAGLIRGDDGIYAPFIRFFPYGWEIAPIQPRHPRPEAASAIMPSEPGIEAQFVPPVSVTPVWGWEIAPPVLAIDWSKRAPGLKGSSQFPVWSLWINYGWDIPSFQPPHPRIEKSGAIATSEPGIEAKFVPPATTPWGWDIPPVQPPALPYRLKTAAFKSLGSIETPPFVFQPSGWEIAQPLTRHQVFKSPETGDQGTQAQFINFINYGWSTPSLQPPHPRPERAGAIATSEPGIENIFIPPTLVTWGWDIAAPFVRYRRLADPEIGDQGTQASLINFIAYNWSIPPFQPPHPRPERAGAIMPSEPGIEAQFVFTPATPIIWGWEQPPLQLKKSTATRYFGIEGSGDFAFFDFQPYGWELPSFQPSHPRPERSGAIPTGDQGTQNTFTFVPPAVAIWGWEVQPFQPVYRINRLPAMLKGDEGIQAQFVRWFNMGWEIPPFQPRHPRPEHAGAIMVGHQGIDAPYVFVPPPVPTGHSRIYVYW